MPVNYRIGSTTQVSNVIVDNSKDDEEDDTFLVEEAPPANIEVAHVRIPVFFNHAKFYEFTN